ncbi:hypothetical protein CC77DRAFT_839996 [Alternaria alternata]|uniref:Uncharacterized protein n=1 Tax=Alternaria alternata TaxID=5599 RepID=A0A177DPX8_ALTAL|nr:hypothetical protein CC77DRAFT_839996 [Alternaria alternata]OAG21815.1 hypothetical protein CC77DRAFT_839996 [Alternaria alternata]
MNMSTRRMAQREGMRRKSPSPRIMSKKPKNWKPGRTTQSAASTKKIETARHGLNDTGKTMTLRETTAMDRMISIMESQGKRRTTRTHQKTSHTMGGRSTTRDLLTMGNLTRSGLLTTTRAPTTIRACTTKKGQKKRDLSGYRERQDEQENGTDTYGETRGASREYGRFDEDGRREFEHPTREDGYPETNQRSNW